MTTHQTDTRPFRYEQVGSLLRPESLKHAREEFSKGVISKEELTAIEDKEISRIIKIQKEIGLKAVTDGEFRRRWWHLDFIAGLNGITTYDYESEAFGIKSTMQGSYISGKLSYPRSHPFIEHFKFAQKQAGETIVKQTIPGPNLIYLSSFIIARQAPDTPVYDNKKDFITDLIKTYQDAIAHFYEAGCRYIQIDDTSWGALFDDRFRSNIQQKGYNPDELIQEFHEITDSILDHKPDDLTVTFHLCKGNFQSHWLYTGSYEKIAESLLSIKKIDGFFLEFDDERSGSFDILRYLGEQRFVLGLISSKNGNLESPEFLKKRIKEASEFAPLNQLCLSPQCGFSSTQEGNKLTEQEQWEKLKLVIEVAKSVWDDSI